MARLSQVLLKRHLRTQLLDDLVSVLNADTFWKYKEINVVPLVATTKYGDQLFIVKH